MTSSLILTVVFACAAVIIHESLAERTNCGVGNECISCPYKQTLRFARVVDEQVTRHAITVCCKSCSRYFTAGLGKDSPYCTCNYDRISGTCWKGEQCSGCDPDYVGSVKGVPVCCANCERKGLILSPTSCDCNN